MANSIRPTFGTLCSPMCGPMGTGLDGPRIRDLSERYKKAPPAGGQDAPVLPTNKTKSLTARGGKMFRPKRVESSAYERGAVGGAIIPCPIFLERQVAHHCGMHVLNSLCNGQAFVPMDLYNLAQSSCG